MAEKPLTMVEASAALNAAVLRFGAAVAASLGQEKAARRFTGSAEAMDARRADIRRQTRG